MKSEEYIAQHLEDDVRDLALRPIPEGVDMKWCLEQIEGWQMARKKLPHWAMTNGLWFPPKLSMEQCSSDETARYKAEVVKRLFDGKTCGELVDLTGGYGVDFSYIAPLFRHATYVERQQNLCEIARHNFPLLGLNDVDILCSDGIRNLPSFGGDGGGLIYLDPARRDNVGRKTVAIEDCSPNVVELQDELLKMADVVMIKLSPMLDITEALRKLKGVREIHVVSVKGECKELVVSLTPQPLSKERGVVTTVTCVNLGTDERPFQVDVSNSHPGDAVCDEIKTFLYEPNASILKAGVQDWLTERMRVKKLHRMSNLFTCDEALDDFPGRKFRVERVYDFSKQSLKELQQTLSKANLTVRNFPATVDQLRKKLKLKEGGDVYLFATTLSNDRHVLVKTSKLKPTT